MHVCKAHGHRHTDNNVVKAWARGLGGGGQRGEMGTPVIVSSIKKRRLHFFDPGSEAQNICMT